MVAADEEGRSESPAHRVLIVDDDVDFVASLGEALSIEGYDVARAKDADEAAATAAHFLPEVAILDLRLGRSDGLDLVPAIRERSPFTKFIVLTAYPDVEPAVRGIRLRIEDFLRKPASHWDLMQALKRCFSEPRAGGPKRVPWIVPI